MCDYVELFLETAEKNAEFGHEENEDFEDFAPKSQILLVCCWRAMKEVSLLLGEITKRAPVRHENASYGLLSFHQVSTFYEFKDGLTSFFVNYYICICTS